MANAVWPVSLPQEFFIGAGLQDTDNDVVRGNVENGPAKQRQRYTASVDPARIQETMVLTDQQCFALRAFYRVTLKKVLPFDWISLISGTAESYRFVGPPSYNLIRGGLDYTPAAPEAAPPALRQAKYQVTIQLEAVDPLT